MACGKTVNIILVKPLVDKLHDFGVDRRIIEQETKLPLLIEELNQERVPYQLSKKLGLIAVRYGLINEAFIHKAISNLDPQRLQGLDWVYATFLAGENLGQAINNFIRFHSLLSNVTKLHVVELGALIRIYISKPQQDSDPSLTIHDEISRLGMLAQLIRCYLGDPRQSFGAHFQCRMKNQQAGSVFDELFLSPVSYSAGFSYLELPKELLEVRGSSTNVGLNAFVMNKAELELTKLPTSHSLANKIKYTLQESLCRGETVDIEVISEQLNTSRWSLNRRLQHEEISFQQLSDEVKKEMALELVLQQQQPSIEVGYMLGYSGQSAFNRAFKRWYGISIRELLNH